MIDLDTLGQSGFTPYYRLGAGSVLLRAADGAYEVTGSSGTVPIGAALYKLSDTRYLIGSDRLTLQLSAGNTVEAEGYVEVTYIDSSVIRLVSADGVYYTVASDAEVVTPSGVRCCLADKRVRDSADNVLFKMSEVLLDADAAIEVLPGEDVEWVVPRFDITTVDGDDGKSGDDGIEGEQGAEGVSGADGTEGTSGTSGTSGASGASGSAGATGGTAGSSGEEGIVMPDFLLTDFSVGDTGFTGELTVTDGDDLLRDDDSYNSIYVVELATGRETLVESTFRSATDTFSFLSAVNGTIELSGLKTDTRYRLVVRSSYEANGVTFQRVFVSKEFSTDSMGLELKNAYATQISGTVRLIKKDYSSAEGARLVLYLKSAFVSSASEEERLAAVDLDRTDLLLSGKDITFDSLNVGADLTPNTEYVVVLKARDSSGGYVTSESLLTFTTLKALPEIEAPVVVTDQRNSVFTLTPKIVSDLHGSIEKYTYEIYNALTGDYIKSVTTTSSEPYTLTIDGYQIERDVFYKARVRVACNDNEKIVELTSGFSNEFVMRGTGYPYVSFSYETTYVDAAGTERPLAPNELSSFSRVNGTLYIGFNGAAITIGNGAEQGLNPLKVAITSLEDYRETRFYYLDGTDLNIDQYNNKFLEIPIVRNGLKADASYLISVYGTVDLGDGRGAQDNFLIGNCVFQTADVPELQARWSQPTESNTALAVYFALEPTADTAYADAALAADTLTRLTFSLYAGSATGGNLIATRNYVDGDTAYFASTIGDATFDSPSGLLITENFFQVDASQLPANVTVTVTDGVDYTYTASGSQPAAEADHNATTSRYVNSIPIHNNSIAINKSNTPPPIPETQALTVLPIYNANATDFGLLYNNSLKADTVVGYKLTANYQNDQALTRDITYYVYENKRFTDWKMTGTQENPARPGVNTGLSESSGYIAQTTVSGITGADLSGSYAIVVLAGTGLSESIAANVPSNYILLEGAFTETHADVYSPYGTGLSWGRGWQYFFAYDAMISLNNTATTNHQFPYDNVEYNGTDILGQIASAYYQAPLMLCYPYRSHTDETGTVGFYQTTTWGYYLTDADRALLAADNFKITVGTTSSYRTLTPSADATSPTLQTCHIAAGAGKAVSTQLKYYRLIYPTAEMGEMDAFFYTQMARETMSVGAISTTLENRLADSNALYLKLTGAEGALRNIAAVKVVANDAGGNTATFYLRLNVTPAIGGESAYGTAAIMASKLKNLSGAATFYFYALYDTQLSGFQYGASNLYAVQVMDTTNMYLVPNASGNGLIASSEGINGSLFTINSFTKTGEVARASYLSQLDGFSGTLLMDMTATGVYYSEDKAQRLTLKQLGEVMIGNTVGTSIVISTPVPFIAFNRANDLTVSVDRAEFTYKVEGARAGTVKDDKVHIALYQKGEGAYSDYTLVDNDVVATVINYADATRYTELITGLSIGTDYQIRFWAELDNGDGTYREVTLLRQEGEVVSSAVYEFTTVDSVMISNLAHTVRLNSYSDKQLLVSYDLDRIFGFHIEFDLEVWDPDAVTGEEGETGAYVPYKSYDELVAAGVITPYAAGTLYSTHMSDYVFSMSPGSPILPGGRYRIAVRAIANELQEDGTETQLGVGYREFTRAAAIRPMFSVLSEPKYTAATPEGAASEHSITFTIMPSDAQKVVVGGAYLMRLFDAAGNMIPLGINGAVDNSAEHSIQSAYTFTVGGLAESTAYTLYFYGVTDLDNTGLGSDGSQLKSIDQMLSGLSAAEQAALLAPIVDGQINPLILSSKTQKTLGESGIEIGTLNVTLRPGTSSYLRVVFTGAYGIASPGPITRVEYMIATADLSYNSQTQIDTAPEITPLAGTGVNASSFVYNLAPQIGTSSGVVYYVTIRLYTDASGSTPAYTATLQYMS